MSAKHTPGPWSIYSITFKGYHQIAGAQGGRLCQVLPFEDEYKANARLIAAAPDLLAALQVLFDEADSFSIDGVYFNEKCMGHKGLDMARAAIAKAEGTP
jgi:hypothetical protein